MSRSRFYVGSPSVGVSERFCGPRSVKWDGRITWFVGLELLCVSIFVVLLAMGRTAAAAAVLVGPLQLLLWFMVAGSGQAALVAFALLVPLATAELLPGAYQRYFLLPGTVGLLALLLLSRRVFAAEPATPRICASERLSMVVLGVWTVASGVVATLHGWGTHGLIWSTLMVVEVLLLIYFAAVIPRSPRDVRVLMYGIVASTTLVAIWVPLAPLVSGGLGGKVVSTPFGVTNLNIVACALAMAGAVSLGLLSGTDSLWPKLALFASVLLCSVALVITRSRGGWFGFGAAFLYVLARSRSKGPLMLAATMALAVLASGFLKSMLVSRATQTTVYDPSMLGRFVLWHFAWLVAKANWLFGVGMDNFRYVKHFYGYPVPISLARQYNAHNLYLEVLADLGVVGFVAFFWLFLSALVKAWRAAASGAARNLGLGLSAGFIACAVHGLVESNMFNLGVFALLGVLIGLSFSLNRLTTTECAPIFPCQNVEV
jgi:O-antigen ligase